MRTRSFVLVTALLVAAALGCSKTDTASTTAGGTTPASPTTTAAPGSSQAPTGGPYGSYGTYGTTPGTSVAPAGGAVKIALAESPLGKILVDGKGMTLYVFAKDTATTSACSASCALAWPAVTGTTVEPGTGLDSKDFTSIKGQDGADQIVYDGHPLYVYAADAGPGQTTGQGVGGTWYVIGADGNPIKTNA
jgi:predicted lipoprotein with Yx(FWY)xxD motif